MQVQAHKDEQAFHLKLDKARSAERDLQDELAGVRAEKEEALQAEEAAKLRLKEVELALAQNNSALEGARAEAEGLRSDVAVRFFSVILSHLHRCTDSCALPFHWINRTSAAVARTVRMSSRWTDCARLSPTHGLSWRDSL